jgi:kynurenine 3-monooxygenase
VLLARRGLPVVLLERRGDPRTGQEDGGRSINLALSARGIRALRRAGAFADVAPLLLPMRGRMLHAPTGESTLQPYGQRPEEVNFSIGRAALNRVLLGAAEQAGVLLRFNQRCLGLDPHTGALSCADERKGEPYVLDGETVIAADGAGSAVRSSLVEAGVCAVRIEPLEHDYKEMILSAGPAGRHVLEPGALHIWPRGGFMLIALPNPGGTFTLTLFLPRSGPVSFAALTEDKALQRFFAEQFPDLGPYHQALCADYRRNPQGQLATVHARGWHLGGRALLLGDAAHAIVPFHGQGMNAAFEDCARLDEMLEHGGDWAALFGQFELDRRPDTEAIARMALENYEEMRERVRDARFTRLQQLAFELERRFARRFIPRYSMVTFHPQIPYREALRRGEVQVAILERLDRERLADGGIDYALAAALVQERLPVLEERDLDSRTG